LIHFFFSFFLLSLPPPLRSTLFPYTTLFRSIQYRVDNQGIAAEQYFFRRQLFGPSLGPLLLRRQFGNEFNGHEDGPVQPRIRFRSEEHTSELQSLRHLVCRLLLEKKKRKK